MENKELISKAVNFAKENATDSAITIQDIATNAGFSTDYFNRLFFTHTGFTVMAYVNYLRLKRATQLLRTTDKTILDIALEVGFNTHEGFLKAFKKQYDITPGNYRVKMKNKAITWGELADKSFAKRFINENNDFQIIDSDMAIDYLFENDVKKYAYICIAIKGMGYTIVAPDGNWSEGFILIGDDRRGNYYLEAVTDNPELLANWLNRFDKLLAFYTSHKPAYMYEKLYSFGIQNNLSHTPQSLYLKDKLSCRLPENISIRALTYSDKDQILKWANGRNDGYVKHLLNEQHYSDPAVLEYGVFVQNELIAIAGCGIDEAHGLKINNACVIRFADGKATDELYLLIFTYVTNDILDRKILPFDDIQHGEYAKTHGGFTAEELGFEIVNYRYDII